MAQLQTLDSETPCLRQGDSRGQETENTCSSTSVVLSQASAVDKGLSRSSNCKQKHPWPFSSAVDAEWQKKRRNQSAPAASYVPEQPSAQPPFPGKAKVLLAEEVRLQLERLNTFQDFQTVSVGKERVSPRTMNRLSRPVTPRPAMDLPFTKRLENIAINLAQADDLILCKDCLSEEMAKEEEDFMADVVSASLDFRQDTEARFQLSPSVWPVPLGAQMEETSSSSSQPVLAGFVRASVPTEKQELPALPEDDMEEVVEKTVLNLSTTHWIQYAKLLQEDDRLEPPYDHDMGLECPGNFRFSQAKNNRFHVLGVQGMDTRSIEEETKSMLSGLNSNLLRRIL